MQENLNELPSRVADLRDEMRSLNTLADSFGIKLVMSLSGAVIHGRKLSDVFRGLALSMSNQALSMALHPLGNMVGGLFANLFPSQGVTPFAQGGVVNSPVLFPMRGGAGMAGEAGPEAILPLQRGADGKLGIRSASGSATNITINISTPDAASFRQSQSQVAALVSRAVARGQRNL
jgi:phage-related minor tail protein